MAYLHQMGMALMLLLAAMLNAAASDAAARVLVMEIEGTIGPITADYFHSGMRKAEDSGVGLVVLRLDTPGGLDAAMRDIVKEILAAQVPVACFVSPSGARAASAGTYILYACHVAAMAPATNLGSATPVQIGGFPGLPDDGGSRPGDADEADDASSAAPASGSGETGPEPAATGDAAPDGTAMQRKIVNDAAAFIRGLAKLRGRDADWAERAVRRAENLTADEALQRGVIDLVATDTGDLLRQIDGRQLTMAGESRTLRTVGAQIEAFEPDWRIKILSAITNPNIAYVLMLVGIYGLIYELANPGAILPGVMGAIALVTALLAFQALPVNYAGLTLLMLGIGFMVLEVFVPSFGALGIGGVIAFVIGSLILYRDDPGQIGVAIPLIGTFALLSAALFVGLLGYALRSHRRPVVSGREEMLHAVGVAEEDFATDGWVRVHSESWNADATAAVRKGQPVRVTGMNGLRLTVEPLNEDRGND